jgi:hypothetical protein
VAEDPQQEPSFPRSFNGELKFGPNGRDEAFFGLDVMRH